MQFGFPNWLCALLHGREVVFAVFVAIEVNKIEVDVGVDIVSGLLRWTVKLFPPSMLLAAIVLQTVMLCTCRTIRNDTIAVSILFISRLIRRLLIALGVESVFVCVLGVAGILGTLGVDDFSHVHDICHFCF